MCGFQGPQQILDLSSEVFLLGCVSVSVTVTKSPKSIDQKNKFQAFVFNLDHLTDWPLHQCHFGVPSCIHTVQHLKLSWVHCQILQQKVVLNIWWEMTSRLCMYVALLFVETYQVLLLSKCFCLCCHWKCNTSQYQSSLSWSFCSDHKLVLSKYI